MKYKWTCFVLLALAMAQMTQAGVYRWVDKDGTVHFGDQPPVDVKQKTEIKPPPKAGVVPATSATPAVQDAEFRKRQADRAEHEKKSATAEKAKADKEERCRKMKTSVDEMQSGIRLYDYDKSGQRYYLDEQQVAKARADAKSAYAKECQ